MSVEWKDIITLIISVAGLSLGITNWIKSSILDSRTRLRITPKIALRIPSGYYSTVIDEQRHDRVVAMIKSDDARQLALGAEISNLSSFPVFIDEVGVFNSKNRNGNRGVISIRAITIPEGSMPYRLDPRQSVTFYSAPGELYQIDLDWNALYVETSHGHRDFMKIPYLLEVLQAEPK
jgi:hypothetical protein